MEHTEAYVTGWRRSGRLRWPPRRFCCRRSGKIGGPQMFIAAAGGSIVHSYSIASGSHGALQLSGPGEPSHRKTRVTAVAVGMAG